MLDSAGDKWDRLTSGFTQFLYNDTAAAVGIGIGFFPVASTSDACSRCNGECGCLTQCGCPCDQRMVPRTCGAVCDPASYRMPDVEIGPMPENGASIAASLFAQNPFGRTTIRPALRGALDHVASYTAAHPSERVVEVLIVGGPPNTDTCQPNSISDCAAVVGSANTETRVVAFEYDGPSLDALANRGGDRLHQIDSRENIAVELSSLVDDIRGEAHCEYELPPGVADTTPITVEVKTSLDAGSGSTIFPVEQVKNRDACDGGRGWYFDRSGPTRIVTCDDTCRRIHGPPRATVLINVCLPPTP
jgi:hypothetical protein